MTTAAPMKVEINVQFDRGRRGRKRVTTGGEGSSSRPASRGRLPRVTKLMALAIRFERLVQTGEVASYAELARLGHVTRARMTQIMAFLHLAPDIQDALLNLQPVERGRDPITERDIRPIFAEAAWGRQRNGWHNLLYVSQNLGGLVSSRSGHDSDNTRKGAWHADGQGCCRHESIQSCG